MNAHQWLANASLWLWPRLADHLWQATLFATVILTACFALRHGPARLRHTFWLLASAKFIIPASIFVFVAQKMGLDALPFLRAAQAPEHAALVHGISDPVSTLVNYQLTVVATAANTHNEIYCALSLIWIAGCAAFLLAWGIRSWKFTRSLRLARTVYSGREWQALEHAQVLLGFRREVRLKISSLPIEPGVWRVWKPVIVLPDSIVNQLDDNELEAIMLHELVHIERRDNLVSTIQQVLRAALWFHPLVWFINRKIFDEREQACDERVIEICGAPETYAASIMKVVRFSFGGRMAGVTGAGSGSNLRRRIENIMSMSSTNTKRNAVSTTVRLVAVAVVGAAFLVLVGTGVYSRSRTPNVSSNGVSSSEIIGVSNVGLTSPDGSTKEKRKGRLTPPPPPPPPAEPIVNIPSSHAQPPQPPVPATPPAPPAPEEMSSAPEGAKQNSKAKNKDKIVKGALIEAPKPDYPDEVKAQKIEGVVAVVITIGNDGNVIYAKAKSGPQELYAVSEAAARMARFKPTMLEGKPVKVTGVMTYDFVLDKE